MQPLGRKPCRFPGKTDHHVKKYGLRNWWEGDEMGDADKRSARQQVKKEIEKEVLTYKIECV